MNENKPSTYTQNKKLIGDWKDKKNYLCHYRMLKFLIKQGVIVNKVMIHEIISFRQTKWLKIYISFNTQNGTELKMNLKKTSINYLITHLWKNNGKF